MVEESRRYFLNKVALYGLNYLNVRETTTFCTNVLSLAPLRQANIRIYEDCKFKVPGTEERLSPLAAIQTHAREGDIRCYVGISGAADRMNRPLQALANKYYGGSKLRALADGWQVHYLLDFLDPEFNNRRYNIAWAEHLLQVRMENHLNVVTTWNWIEPAPLFGENRSKIPNHGAIGLYICLKFED